MEMRTAVNTLIRRVAGTIAVIAFLVTGSIMLSGGCSNNANSCNGNDQVRLACPAVSLETVSCIGYSFDIHWLFIRHN